MSVIQGRSTFKKILYSPITVLLLAVVCALLAASVYDLYQKEKHTAEARDEVKQQEARLAEEKAQMEHKIALLNTPQGIETIVREKQSVARPGEHVVIVQDAPATTTPPREMSWVSRLVAGLFSLFK